MLCQSSHQDFSPLLSLRLLFSLYLLFMTFLTTSLVLAARSTDPSQYDEGLDWFRLFCEVVTLLWVLVDLGLEVYELGRVMLVFSYTVNVSLLFNLSTFTSYNILCSHRSLKQHSISVHRETPVSPRSSPADNGSGKDHDGSDNDDGDKEVPPEPNEEKTNYWLAM